MSYRSNVCLWLSQKAVKKMDKETKDAFEMAFGKPVKTRPAEEGQVWHCPHTGWNQEVDEDDIMGFLESLDKTKGEFYELIVIGEGEDDWQEKSNNPFETGWHLNTKTIFFFDGKQLR